MRPPEVQPDLRLWTDFTIVICLLGAVARKYYRHRKQRHQSACNIHKSKYIKKSFFRISKFSNVRCNLLISLMLLVLVAMTSPLRVAARAIQKWSDLQQG